jgi:DNA-binding protein H-NS
MRARIKYRNPETGETWSGYGYKPRWVRAWLEKKRGRQLDDLLADEFMT